MTLITMITFNVDKGLVVNICVSNNLTNRSFNNSLARIACRASECIEIKLSQRHKRHDSDRRAWKRDKYNAKYNCKIWSLSYCPYIAII